MKSRLRETLARLLRLERSLGPDPDDLNRDEAALRIFLSDGDATVSWARDTPRNPDGSMMTVADARKRLAGRTDLRPLVKALIFDIPDPENRDGPELEFPACSP